MFGKNANYLISSMKRKHQRYGWIPDIPDFRDYQYKAPVHISTALPESVDLRPQCPQVLNQGELGSCTSQAIANAHYFDHVKQKEPGAFLPSRLFIYYNERVIEGTVNEDSGAMIRDGIKSVAKQGACRESLWPYNISKFRKRPPCECYTEAVKHTAIEYRRVSQTLNDLQACLASGYPFVFGIAVYDSFESNQVAHTGIVPMPSRDEQMLGGHCILAVGYQNSTRQFIIQNSWGTDWGINGYCLIPYDYMLNGGLSSDFWVINKVK